MARFHDDASRDAGPIPRRVTERDIALIAAIKRKLESVDHDVRAMRRSIDAALRNIPMRGILNARHMRRL